MEAALFGGMGNSHDIASIVQRLDEGAIVSDGVAKKSIGVLALDEMATSIQKMLYEHYSDAINTGNPEFDRMLTEDAAGAARLFKNGIREYQFIVDPTATAKTVLTESALMPSLVTLTASIATTIRSPYEATLHRLFDTRILEKQTVEIEEVIPTVKGPNDEEAEDLVEALAPYAPVPFVKRTEIFVDELVNGVSLPVSGVKELQLLVGKDPLFRVNRDVRVSHIDAEIDGTAVPAENITFAKGTVPYFDAKDNTLNVVFNIKKANGEIVTADLTAKMDFERSRLTSMRGDAMIKKVYFYATVSHAEHTHPIVTSYRNNYEQFIVPTRPHIEVSLPQETRTDIANSMNHFSNADIISMMTENITTISTRMEDQRLKEAIDSGYVYGCRFNYEPPSNFNAGNTAWLKAEFVPFLDQVALKLKNDNNVTDCHFRVGVSPYILRLLDTDYTMDKGLTEESRGSGVINYSIGIKTSTAVFYFISSQQFSDNEMMMLLIPNNFRTSQVKTYNYFKYASFLTDQLRRHDNSVMPAIVYSERNMPVVFEHLAAKIEIDGMPTMASDGVRYIKRVDA